MKTTHGKRNLFSQINKPTVIISVIWGMIVSLCLVWGYELETDASIFGHGFIHFLTWLVLFCGLSFAACLINVFWDRERRFVSSQEITLFKKIIYVCLFGAVIFILWAPAFLAVYPGWFNYDAPWQIYMYRDGKITSHHPVLHTLLLGTIVQETHLLNVARGDYAYNYNSSVALYNVFQMLICALGLGYQAEFIYERFLIRCRKCVRYIMVAVMLAFFGLYPPIVLLAMSPTKDVLFGIFYLLLVIKVYKIFEKNSKPDLYLAILLILCVIYRQNTAYVFILLAIPFLVILLKKYGRKIFSYGVVCIVITIFVMLLYKGPFYKALNVQPGSKAEFLSVPSQQLVSVYLNHGDELSSEDKAMIENLFKKEAFEGYRPKLADETKGNLNLDVLGSDKSSFASLYLKLFMKYPQDFIDSFLILNYGLWYPDATMDLYEDGENLFFLAEYYLAIPSSKLPVLNDYYMNYASVEHGIKRILLMPALILYLAFFYFLRGCRNKKAGKVLTGLATILIFATFLLGPCACIRYVYFIYILAPFLVAECINKDNPIE